MKLLWVLAALSTVVLTSSFETDDFDIAQALHSHGLDINRLDHLSALNGQCSCSDACSTLTTHYGAEYVLTPNGTAYTAFREAYWSSIQTDLYPECVFQPPDADAVSVLILLSRMTQCPFAFKSGGHSAFGGAASIQGGITVDLKNLNSITLSADKTIALVEPGNNWATVYSKLAENELTAIGGRVARIGVGGLTLGGGISFFSGYHGWACDNVAAYEVVTASGKLVTATPTEYSDLYWALRGGGNNFGIVTKFHLKTVPIPGNVIWGGTRAYLEQDYPSVIQAFTDLTSAAGTDAHAGQWTAFGTFNNTKFCSTTLWYSDPSSISTTSVFDSFNAIHPVSDSTRVRDLTNFTYETQQSNPYGLREVYWTFTTKASTAIATAALDIFFSLLPQVSNITGAFPVLLFQSITVPQMRNMAQDGGNPLGLDPADGPLFLISVPTWWQRAADDQSVYEFVARVESQIAAKAKELGQDNEYVYMNYASRFQDVIQGYGEGNKRRLIQIAKEYDPEGVFQTLQPGYFKLEGPPAKLGG